MKKILFSLFLIINCSLLIVNSYSQVIKWSPLYPTVNDSITIIYDASKGNAGLLGESNVYVHTGVITSLSSSTGDWWNKKALWFDPDSIIKKNITKSLGNNLFMLGFNIKKYYSISSKVKVKELCFVFRNLDGSKVGKNADNSDFIIHVFDPGFSARFISPMQQPIHPNLNETVKFTIAANKKAMFKLFHEKSLVKQSSAPDSVLSWDYAPGQYGKFWLKFEAHCLSPDTTVIDSVYYIVPKTPTVANPPAGTKLGINYTSTTSATLLLYAPNKSNVYLLGDFNGDAFDWQVRPEYQMNRTPDGKSYWIQINNLTPKKEYSFQYYVDFDIKVADPYCEKVLDEDNDPYINKYIYPDLKPYPSGKTSEIVSILQTNQDAYQWEVSNFQKPDNRDIVAYELLVRDFSTRHSYKFVSDSIQYLKRLGVNVIELMPVINFEGNNSWGYMPTFNFAPAKYYGTKNDIKRIVDIAHKNGIAVVLDMVMNHNGGGSPLVRLYYDKDKKRTKPENPWFNVEIPHPFGQFYDFNHEADVTKALLDSVLSFWVREYHIDGYRMDLSKGFTQKYTGTDVGGWGQFDQSRVNILKRMADVFWKKHPGTWLILEHFANNDEEVNLCSHGFMLWGKANWEYSQAAQGWIGDGDDFSWGISYKNRNFPFHNLYGYMESHDEERVMYRILNYGNGSGSYSTKTLKTALDRMALVNAFFLPVPGPKMLWQFAELGYDYSIYWPGQQGNDKTRMSPKPVKWTYFKDPDRFMLYKKVAAIAKLKTLDKVFRTSYFEVYANHYDKRIRLWDDGSVGGTMSCVIVGNFDVVDKPVWPEFTTAGSWYDYFTGQSIQISQNQTANNGFSIPLKAGEFRIYTSKQLPLPDLRPLKVDTVGINSPDTQNSYYSNAYPNPFSDKTVITFTLAENDLVSVRIYNLIGQEIKTLISSRKAAGTYEVTWDGTDSFGNKVKDGYYLYTVKTSRGTITKKLSLIH